MLATILSVLLIIVSLVLIVVVLMQSSDQAGLSGTIAGGAETFFGKNKGRTIDAVLKKWTAVIAAIFVVLAVVLSIFLG